MKKTVFIWVSIFMMFGFSACEEQPPAPPKTIPVSSIRVDQTSLSLAVGGSYTLIPTVMPDNATNKTVTWTSGNPSVATVDADGKVMATAAGTATITAKAGDQTAGCTLTVTVAVSGISLDKTELSLAVGENATLIPTVTPANATNPTVTWTSGNPSVATVDANGKVMAVAAGTAVITVTTLDGNKTANCVVTVTQPVADVSLNKNATTLTVGATEQLTVTVLPSNATNKNVTWSSNYTNIAAVSDAGLITAIAEGTATITVTTQDGNKTAQCAVTVNPATALPTLTTNAATNITATAATLGGNITNAGTPAYTERGVVYATTQNPTTANNKTVSTGTGTGSFTANVSGLTANTTYYVRAYATNTTGTAYGAQMGFTTSSINPLQDIKLALIPGGTFTMGSPTSEPERSSNETQHTVTLSSFYISEHAITNEQYCRFLNATGVSSNGQGNVSGFGNQTLVQAYQWGVQYTGGEWRPATGYANYPVVYVSWYGAKAFCDWAGGRLPTEAEWEYACRAGTTTPFNTGNNLTTSQANFDGRYTYNDNSTGGIYLGRPQPVGSYAPNAWGLYDMHGTVWEWCSDWYGSYGTGAVTNPTGPSTGSYRVYRGGGRISLARDCRSAYRGINYPVNLIFFGFRMAVAL